MILIALVMIIALAMLLVPRKEGATTKDTKPTSNGQCYNSMMEYNEETGKFGTGVVGPPLDPKKCKNLTVKMGGKCYRSNGSAWNPSETSKTCHSWVKLVDWKSSKAKNRYPVYDGYTRSVGKWGGGDLGSVPGTVDDCGKKCTETAGCTGFTFAKTKSGKDLVCWMRSSGKDDIVKKENTWFSYIKKDATASGSSSGGDGNTVYLYETANFEVNQPFEVDEYPDLRTRNFNDKAKSMVIPNGLNVTVYEDIGFVTKAKKQGVDVIRAAATFGPGRHVLSDPEFLKSLTPDTASSRSIPYDLARTINGWANEISSMKVFRV